MLQSFSWVIDHDYAVKYLDKSALFNQQTGIPKNIAPFFILDDTLDKSGRAITLLYHDIAYEARLTMDQQKRFRLHWKKDFAQKLTYKFSTFIQLYEQQQTAELAALQAPLLRFIKSDEAPHTYVVEMLNINMAEEQAVFEEGRPLQYFMTRYERSSVVREAALAIHGYNCAACGFNFEKMYGELGKNYIEIHHVRPLSNVQAQHHIDPASDLVPLCANCHRIVHRHPSEVLSVETLQREIKAQHEKRV